MRFRDFLVLLFVCATAVPFLVKVCFKISWWILGAPLMLAWALANVVARIAYVLEKKGKSGKPAQA